MKAVVTLGVAGVIALGSGAFAQNSPDYHARHNAQSPYYVGPDGQAPQSAPLPTGFWKETWGAIAANGAKGFLGTAVGASSEKEAKHLALLECNQQGAGCQVEMAYYNQCAALVTGDKWFTTARAKSIERASELGIAQCEKAKDSNCHVYYSACTDPVYHKF